MWVAPSYLALLAGRRGVAAPDAALEPSAYLRAVRESGADYVFLSEYDPRDTRSSQAWQAGTLAVASHATVVQVRARNDGVATSILLKIRE